MLSKVAIIGCIIATAPICFMQSAQDKKQTTVMTVANPATTAELARLRAAVVEAKNRAAAAEARTDELRAELGECMSLLVRSTDRRSQSCRPSRSLLTYYRWFDERKHEKQAKAMFERICKQIGNRHDNIESFARRLMTSKDTAGQFDRLALALTERFTTRRRHIAHRALDTKALAYFLNGKVDGAIRLQREALKQSNQDGYRRRLRTYEAARHVKPTKAETRRAQLVSLDR